MSKKSSQISNKLGYTKLQQVDRSRTDWHNYRSMWTEAELGTRDGSDLKFQSFTLVLRCRRLSWYSQIQWAMSCIKSITNFPRSECVKTDVNKCGLAGIDPQDRDAWRVGVQHSLVLQTRGPMEWDTGSTLTHWPLGDFNKIFKK